ncbi:MAG: shikimate dehydrogenase [Saprospiraceae bacterium]
MKRFGLIGYPLGHSFSAGYFTDKFARLGLTATHEYRSYPLERIEDFPALRQRLGDELAGLNVTIPHKQAIIPYLDELSEAAREIGAVNTIAVRNGRLMGHNTDVIGFGEDLDELLPEDRAGISALVLGTGGAARAVWWSLERRGIPYTRVSRNKGKDSLTYDQAAMEVVRHNRLIVNTTPLGMAPHLTRCPRINYDGVGPQHYLYDLVYNPARTTFLKEGLQRGATGRSGLGMLHGQAEAAWKIWTHEEGNGTGKRL